MVKNAKQHMFYDIFLKDTLGDRTILVSELPNSKKGLFCILLTLAHSRCAKFSDAQKLIGLS